MQKSIEGKLGFKKSACANIYKKNGVILKIVSINKETRTFTIIEQNSDDFINSYREFFTIIELKYINKFLLLSKCDYKKLASVNLSAKIGERYVYEYGIFPIMGESQTAYVKNKYDDEAYFSTILLDKNDVICIINDELQMKETKRS